MLKSLQAHCYSSKPGPVRRSYFLSIMVIGNSDSDTASSSVNFCEHQLSDTGKTNHIPLKFFVLFDSHASLSYRALFPSELNLGALMAIL